MEEIREEKKGDRRDLVSAPAFLPFLDPISAEEKERQAFQPFFLALLDEYFTRTGICGMCNLCTSYEEGTFSYSAYIPSCGKGK